MEPVGFWGLSLDDFKNLSKMKQSKSMCSVYAFGSIKNAIFCNNCLKYTKSFYHRCVVKKFKNVWLSKKKLIIQNKKFFETYILQNPILYKICEYDKTKINFHSILCLEHLNNNNSNSNFVCIKYYLYDQIVIPQNFSYDKFCQQKLCYPVEAYSNVCTHKK